MTETSAGAGAPARISAIRWPLLLVLASLAALAPVATDLYLPGFPELGADFGAEASAVQLTLTSFLVGLAFGQLVMGPLSDRRGRRGPLIVSASVCVAAGVVCALAPTLPVLVLARLVGALHRLSDRLCISEVVLLSLRIGAHVLRRHQSGIVTKRFEPTAEMMRADTGLHPDQAGRHVRES